MTEIYNLFRSIVVLIFIGALVWGASQILPQAQSAATLPARIEADNARILQEAHAVPTFIALNVEMTRVAMRNTEVLANAQANAQTIAAQGVADGERARAARRAETITLTANRFASDFSRQTAYREKAVRHEMKGSYIPDT